MVGAVGTSSSTVTVLLAVSHSVTGALVLVCPGQCHLHSAGSASATGSGDLKQASLSVIVFKL